MSIESWEEYMEKAAIQDKETELRQLTIHLEKQQMDWLLREIDKRSKVGLRCSVSSIIRETIDTGFLGVAKNTEAIVSQRIPRRYSDE
jgi:hypothetical protein